MLCDRLGVSERWACKVVGQHRSTQRREPERAGDDAALRAQLRAFSAGNCSRRGGRGFGFRVMRWRVAKVFRR